MNIFLRELRAGWKSLLVWCGAQYFLIFVGMMKYKSFSESGADLEELLSAIPKSLMTVFGIGTADLSRVEGFYSVFFPYFLLLGAIQACMLGAVLIAKEERDHSADFLFAKPVTRNRVVTAKLLAGLFQALVFNLVTLAASVYHVEQYNTSGAPLAGRIAVMMLALFVFQVTFLAVGIAFGANLRNARGATSAAAGVILGTYFLSVGIDMNGKLGFLRYLTPFKYFPAQDLMSGESIAWWALLLCAVWTAASLACAYMRFKRRDLTV